MRPEIDRRRWCRRGILMAAWLLAPWAGAEAAAHEHLEITGRHTLRVIYDVTFRWPRGGVYRAVFYLPRPPETGCQSIDAFTSNLHGASISTAGNPPRELFRGALEHDAGDDRDVIWRVETTGTFQMRELVEGPAPTPTPPAKAPAPGEFLASTQSIDWDNGDFRDWLDDTGLKRKEGEAAVDFARRVYDYCVNHGGYDYPPRGGWTASGACHRLRTDCGGFSLVFVAACRANHVPARTLVGQWFKTRESGDGTVELTGRQAHVIAEFFDPEIGWIPEDISSALMRVGGRDDYFGREPGYFFTWHTDTDFHFDVPRKSDEYVQWIQNPSFWFSENADDAEDSLSHRWRLETVK